MDYDETGYRYDRVDPETNAPGRKCRIVSSKLASSAATEVGFDEFLPMPASSIVMSLDRALLHQDKMNEISSSRLFGVPGSFATFLFGGSRRKRRDGTNSCEHGDVIVWGGPAAASLPRRFGAQGRISPLAGGRRFNLTFRKAT